MNGWQITVTPYREKRFHVAIERGQFVSGFDITHEEAEGLIEALQDALREVHP